MKKLLVILLSTLSAQALAADTIKLALTGPYSGGSAPMGISTRDGSGPCCRSPRCPTSPAWSGA